MFEAYLIACLLLTLGPHPRVWAVLSISALVDYSLVLPDAPWTLLVSGGMEAATILMLLRFAPGRAATQQAWLLTAAWVCHGSLLWDVTYDSNLIYDQYESVMFAILSAQVFLGVHAALRDPISVFCSRLAIKPWRVASYFACTQTTKKR